MRQIVGQKSETSFNNARELWNQRRERANPKNQRDSARWFDDSNAAAKPNA